MLGLKETAAGLTITMPAWLGALMIFGGLLFVVFLVRGRPHRIGEIFSLLAATFVLFAGGWGFIVGHTTLDDSGVVEYGTFGEGQRTTWNSVTSYALETRTRRRSTTNYLVLRLRSGGQHDIRLSGLDGADDMRVREYVKRHVPGQAP